MTCNSSGRSEARKWDVIWVPVNEIPNSFSSQELIEKKVEFPVTINNRSARLDHFTSNIATDYLTTVAVSL